jgi:chromosome segregation and condensation protein ScpB
LTSDGEKPDRNRDAEFEITATDTQQILIERWESGWAALFSALEPLTDADLERTVTIRGEPLSVLQAINRQLTHYSYHVGQIVYVAKHYAGSSWRSLSIPRGKSVQFNANPAKYVKRA